MSDKPQEPPLPEQPQPESPGAAPPTQLRDTTRNLLEAVWLDTWPRAGAIVDFGIDSQEHYEALYYGIREGEITPEALDATLGHGEKLTALARSAPSNPHRDITFSTSWDVVLGRTGSGESWSENDTDFDDDTPLVGKEAEALYAEWREDYAARDQETAKPGDAKPVYGNYEMSPRVLREDGHSEVAADGETPGFWRLSGHVDGQDVETIGDFESREAAAQVHYRITGMEYSASYDASPRLRIMHAGPVLLNALEDATERLGVFEREFTYGKYREFYPELQLQYAAIELAKPTGRYPAELWDGAVLPRGETPHLREASKAIIETNWEKALEFLDSWRSMQPDKPRVPAQDTSWKVWHLNGDPQNLTGDMAGTRESEYPRDYVMVARVFTGSAEEAVRMTTDADLEPNSAPGTWERYIDVVTDRVNPRNTGVGDVVVDPKGQAYRIERDGFRRIGEPTLSPGEIAEQTPRQEIARDKDHDNQRDR